MDSHGGSLRGGVRTEASGILPEPEVELRIAQEEAAGLFRPEAYEAFSKKISGRGEELKQLLLKLKKEGKRIAGFGAPAKATTLMYHFGLGPDRLEAGMDASPGKQGLYTPGHHIPVVPAGWLANPKNRPDYCLILAWNFAEPIIKKHEAYRQAGGRFIIPLPELTIR